MFDFVSAAVLRVYIMLCCTVIITSSFHSLYWQQNLCLHTLATSLTKLKHSDRHILQYLQVCE